MESKDAAFGFAALAQETRLKLMRISQLEDAMDIHITRAGQDLRERASGAVPGDEEYR